MHPRSKLFHVSMVLKSFGSEIAVYVPQKMLYFLQNVTVSSCLLMSLVTTKINVISGNVHRSHCPFLSFSLKTGM